MDTRLLASLLDATILNPTATTGEIQSLFEFAVNAGCQVCVNESRLGQLVTLANSLPEGNHRPRISSVIGFPLGSTTTGIKVHSARSVLAVGADEIDMVANVAWLKEKDYDGYHDDIAAVADVVAEFNAANNCDRVLKVIIETCYLNDDEKRRAAATISSISREHDLPMFVKTSTGFGTPPEGIAKGATVEDVLLLRQEAGPYHPQNNRVGIKASGGVKTREDVLNMIAAATKTNSSEISLNSVRIGTSSAELILK